MTQPVYQDAGLTLDDDGLTIRRYYFPFATSKRIAYSTIRGVEARAMDWLTGKGRLWGSGDLRHWLPLDGARASKKTLLILDVGSRVRPCITPDDPGRVVELLHTRVKSN